MKQEKIALERSLEDAKRRVQAEAERARLLEQKARPRRAGPRLSATPRPAESGPAELGPPQRHGRARPAQHAAAEQRLSH
jgi:hypothetical protein